MKKSKYSPNFRKCLKVLLVLLILLSTIPGCAQRQDNFLSVFEAHTGAENANSDTPEVTPLPSSTSTAQPLAAAEASNISSGTLIFCDHSGVYTYDVQSDTLKILDQDGDKIYEDVTLVDETLYFLRTTESYIGFGQNEIYQIDLDGTDLTRVTYDEVWESSLSASPDNTRLAFTQDTEASTNRYQLLIMNLENRLYEVVATKNESNIRFPLWSPDGKKIAFFEGDDSEHPVRLYLYDFISREIIELLPEETLPMAPISWSPDMTHLAIGVIVDEQPGIYSFNVDSQELTKLTATDEIPENIQWSPDGKYILFEYSYYASLNRKAAGLFILDTDSRQLITVKKGGIDGSFYTYQARWSPDGKYVEFIYNYQDDAWKIKLIEVENGKAYDLILPSPYDTSLESWIFLSDNSEP